MTARWPKLAPAEVPGLLRGGVSLLDFYQETCPPCRALEPRLEAFAERHPDDVHVYQLDVDEHAEALERFGVESLPTLIVYREGEEVERLDGLIREDDLEAALARAAGRR